MASKGSDGRRASGGDQAEILIGRKAEMTRLSDILGKAASGRGQFVAISGEPGIGKTSLTRAAAELAQARGFSVFRVRCHEGQYVAPYWPWAQLLRGVLETVQGSKSVRASEGYAESLAAIVSETQRISPEESPEMVRLRLLEAAAGLVRTFSAKKPLLLILDNLHCADEPSLRMLEFVTREMADWNLCIVAAYRPVAAAGGGAFADTIGALASEESFTSIRVVGWDEEAIKEHLRACIADEPPDDLVRAVLERTEGNPLFVTEVVQLLLQDGLLKAGAASRVETWKTHIPEKVRLAILGRVRHLSEHCQETLAAAALVGREFDAALLLELAGKGGAPLEVSLQEALGEGLIEEAGVGASAYRFTHVLIQEAARELVPAPHRAGLHLAIGEALERRYGANVEPHAGELAAHFEAAGQIYAERAVRLRHRAGRRAIEAYGFEDGLRQFEQALEAGSGVISEELRAELIECLAQCQHGVGRFKEALENHRRAFDFFVQEGKIERAIEVLVQKYIADEQGFGVLPMYERIISILGRESPQAHRLGSHYGLSIYQETGNFAEAARVFRLALEDARKTGDRTAEMNSLTNWSRVLHDDLQFEASRETATLAIQFARQDRNLWMEALLLVSRIIALLGLGRAFDAADDAQRVLQVLERFPGRTFMAFALYPSIVVGRLRGDFAAALARSDRALSFGQGVFSTWNVADRALLEYEKGNAAAGARYLERALAAADFADLPFHWNGWVTFLVSYIAWVSGEQVPLEQAERDARLVAAKVGMPRGDALNVSVGLGLIAVMRGDAAAARKHYAELEPFSGLVVCPYYGLTADHMLALLAGASGDVPLAGRHFESALSFCRSSGLRLELAYTCRDYGEMLAESGQSAHRERALACCRDAWEIAQAADLPPLTRRLKELRKRLEQRPAPRAAPAQAPAAAPLTPREIEVICLLVDGLSNEQIGDKLFISVHTVANHVQRILEKTGASNRTDAAIYAVRNGLKAAGQGPA